MLPSNHIIGMSDHHLPLSRLLDSPPLREKRIDPKDGNSYTREEFLVYYGLREGQERWYQAVVDEVEMACAQVITRLIPAIGTKAPCVIGARPSRFGH